jgi:hypothetical protein
MPITTDFLLLYQELRVTPDCSIAHFKRAYRRRVSELHPDRASGGVNPVSAGRLQSLTRLHDEAMRFHSRHGRLPGASQSSSATGSSEAKARPSAVVDATSHFPSMRRLLIGLLIAAAIAVAWYLLPSDDADTNTIDFDQNATTQDDHRIPTVDNLAIGMDEASVRRIQGEPAILSVDRWEYGPSYVRFERHKVVGWYSSPLYPLKTGTPHHRLAKGTE